MKQNKLFPFVTFILTIFILYSCSTFNGNYIEQNTKNANSFFTNKDKISHLSDEFNDSKSLSNWKIFNQDGLPIRIKSIDINNRSKGKLFLDPYPAAWYEGYHGVFAFKNIKGNFIATTSVKVNGEIDELPKDIWSLAGMLVREPDSRREMTEKNKENWIYLMTGRGPKDDLVIDWKSTRNNANYWTLEPRESGWIQLGIVRVGPLFYYLHRYDNEGWKIGKKRYVRYDFPIELQVGISVTADILKSVDYSFMEFNSTEIKDETDLVAYWDYFRIRRPNINSNLQKKIINQDFDGITDKELFSVLR